MRSDPLSGLSCVVRELAEAAEVDDVLMRATDAAVAMLDAEHASIRLCTRDDALRSVARSGVGADAPPPSFHKGQGVIGWVALTGRVARLGDAQADRRFRDDPTRGFDVRSVMSIPIVGGSRVFGVLSMSSALPDAFSIAHEQVGVVLAHCLGQSLRAAELQRVATTDAVTRAFDRDYLATALDAEMNRARRHGRTFSLLALDLDRFSEVDQALGRAIGDAVLRRFADVVRACVRSFDVLVRREDDALAVLMPGTCSDEARVAAERIRASLQAHPLRIEGAPPIGQTVSIGLATWDGRETAVELDERSRFALSEAKHRGRNRVVVAPRQTLWSN